MTLEENKKIVLGLIEEYSPTNMYLTDDEDIRDRLNLVYAPNYQFLSQEKKILKTKTYVISSNEDTTEYNLPYDMYQFKRLVALDSNNKRISPEYEIIGNKIYIQNKEGKYIIEYYAYPTVITTDTENDFVLEIDQDVQMQLAVAVADDILKVDPSANYTAFSNKFQLMLSRLSTTRILGSIEVDEGDI